MTAPNAAALSGAVAACKRLRRPYSPDADRGPFVVTGHPRDWSTTASELERLGKRIVAFQDMRILPRQLWFHRRPVIAGRASGPLAAFPLLFAGEPRKFWFNPGTEALNRCLWHDPPTGWRAAGKSQPALLERQAGELAEVYAMLHDEASRRVFASLVRGRVESCSDYFRVSHYREYAHPIVRARPGDVVLDVGAYDGDSARWYAWHMRGRGRIIALEPSRENFDKLRRRWVPGLEAVCAGAWDSDTTLSFEGTGGSGRIASAGGTTVHVLPLDQLAREMRLERVDLLKLDVEGAEAKALAGAKETILTHRPKLQVSIYHKQRDLFELPLLLRSWLDGYRYFLGHHNFYHTETDLYAIPEERLRA